MHRYRHSFVPHTFVSIEFSVFSVVNQMMTGILCWSIPQPRLFVIHQLDYLCNNCCYSNKKTKIRIKNVDNLYTHFLPRTDVKRFISMSPASYCCYFIVEILRFNIRIRWDAYWSNRFAKHNRFTYLKQSYWKINKLS